MTTESEIEREAVVRWLRCLPKDFWPAVIKRAAEDFADAIERGDHLKERG